MKIRAGLPPGVNALLFGAARSRRQLEARLCARLEKAGYSEVLLPILDYFDPYEPLLSESSRDRLYRFVDRDGQLLALRGDFTPMLARLIAPRLSALELPQKLFYRGDVVRYQEVRPGRMREYSELGVELLDRPSADHDGDALSLFVELLIAAREGETGLATGVDSSEKTRDLRVVVGLAGALDDLVLGLGGDHGTLSAIARRNREVARKMAPELAQVVEAGRPDDLDGLGAESARRVRRLLDLCRGLEENFGDRGVHVSLDLAEFASCSLDPSFDPNLDPRIDSALETGPDAGSDSGQRATLAEPLENGGGAGGYYDGIVFKAYLEGETAPVGRGGRYDRLFQALGAEAGATGFSLGLDRLLPLAPGESS